MTSGGPAAAADRPRRRPPDRRDEILSVAAQSFSARGYHATRLTEIAEEVGISAPALYRHFSGKYDLFAAAALRLSEQLTAAADAVEACPDPRVELDRLLHALLAFTWEKRAAGSLYRWEARLLAPEDRRPIAAGGSAVHRRVRDLVHACDPAAEDRATGEQATGERATEDRATGGRADVLATAILSVVASPVTHRVRTSRRTAMDVLCDAADRLATLTPPMPADATEAGPGLAPAGRREAILSESISLFARRGYGEVTLEEIGAAVDLPASGVYRHFESKAAILTAAFWRASARTTAAISAGLAEAATPREAVVALARQYSALCVADPDIMTVFLSERGALAPDDLRALRRQQRTNIDEWSTWLQRARPDISGSAARLLVHAALTVAGDLPARDAGVGAETVGHLCAAVMLGADPRSVR
ncbi:TetR/AcrR family transcriptional regulator [Gordonia shandongensis]|uniref:TetR/AcrR family transcriptional regulator n=1 Tax=Gordonia shandongensis TaxID=376351 RepID=UPI00041F9C0E|nr:TetR/AcrR family transcriptional regulator [Gordonia shandongensis]